MKLSRHSFVKSIKRMKEVKSEDLRGFLRTYIDIFTAVSRIPESQWMTVRQKDYFIECVILVSKGTAVDSKEATEYFENNGFKNKIHYSIRRELNKRGWMQGANIHPQFDFSKRKIPKSVGFKFKLVNESDLED